MTAWINTCVLCAQRGRQTRLEAGHCCPACAQRVKDGLSAILRLSEAASGSLVPSANAGGYGAAVFGSKPPLDVSALDPELTLIRLDPDDASSTVTILEALEAWERCIRDDRQMVPYGPASASRSFAGIATLTGVVTFLQGQHEWTTGEPTFCLEDYAGQVARAVKALGRFDVEREDLGQMVKCPSLWDDGTECGYRLYYRDADETITCKRCKVSRDVATLVAVAMSDGREVWLDPEAASSWLGISESTLQRMARRGDVTRSHGRYLIRHEEATA